MPVDRVELFQDIIQYILIVRRQYRSFSIPRFEQIQ